MIDNKTAVKKLRGRPRKNPEDKYTRVYISSDVKTDNKIKIMKKANKNFCYSRIFRKAMEKEFETFKNVCLGKVII
jgi:hypothetical protein